MDVYSETLKVLNSKQKYVCCHTLDTGTRLLRVSKVKRGNISVST